MSIFIFDRQPDTLVEALNRGIPKTGQVNRKQKYFSADDYQFLAGLDEPPELPSEEEFQDEEIFYKFNKYGYRCQPFETPGIRVMSLGCSYTFGLAVPQNQRFTAIFCRKLENHIGKPVVDLNLAWPAESPDYVARMTLTALPIIKPHILLTEFPYMERREYATQDQLIWRYIHPVPPKLAEHQFLMRIQANTNKMESLRRLYIAYATVELSAKYHQIAWLYGIQEPDVPFWKKLKVYNETLRVPSLQNDHKARDTFHPSRLVHEKHAANYWESFKKNYPDLIHQLALDTFAT